MSDRVKSSTKPNKRKKLFSGTPSWKAEVKDIYDGHPVSKSECVGSRLRRLKEINQKGLGGRGKLTDTMIDRLQNYF